MALPQREGRPSLDIAPDATPKTAGWAESFNEAANKLNNPTKDYSVVITHWSNLDAPEKTDTPPTKHRFEEDVD